MRWYTIEGRRIPMAREQAGVNLSWRRISIRTRGGRSLPVIAACLMTLVMVFGLALMPISVAAHTSLLQTDPAPNSTLDHSPDLITLHFDQPLQAGFNKVTIFDVGQRPVTSVPNPAAGTDPSALTIGVPTLKTGVYSVLWQVLSSDGHPVRGAFVFTVALPGDPPPAPVASVPDIAGISTSNRPPFLAVVLRGLRYAGIAALVGGIGIFLATILPALRELPEEERAGLRRTLDQRIQRWLFIALGIALGAHLFSLIVQVATVNGITLGEALQWARISDLVRNTTYGAVWRMQGILLLAIGEWLILLPTMGRLRLPRFPLGIVANAARPTVATAETETAPLAPLWGWGVALLGGLALLLISVFGGHALDVKVHPALAMLADFLHLTAMSLWFGGIILMVGLVPSLLHGTVGATQRRVMGAIIGRFSHLALISIGILTVTGIYAVTVHTTRDTIGTTTYGLVVIGKVALVAGIVLVAALNRFGLKQWIARDVESGTAARAQTMLLRGMSAEVILGVAVIGLTGLLTQLPPANSQATGVGAIIALPSAPVEAVVAQPVLEADDVRSYLTVETKGTDTTFDARITDTAGALRNDVTRVTLWLNSGDKDVGLLIVPLTAAGDGHYRATGQWFAIGQNWLARVVVRRQDVAEDVNLPFALQPRPTAYTEEPVSLTAFLWPRLLPDAVRGIDLLLIGAALFLFAVIVRLSRLARRAMWSGAIGLIVLGATLMAWYSVPTTPLTGRGNPLPTTQDVLMQGSVLYAQNCAVCHGANGAGIGKPGTQLTAATEQRYTDGDLYWLLTNGVAGKGMPPYTTRLSPTERWQVVRYLRSILPHE
ncbi:MAG: copper resistance protein CopC [Chloroflexota bacterium]|nr:copper resistance protein CopC [Chloroflexota bacterium]